MLWDLRLVGNAPWGFSSAESYCIFPLGYQFFFCSLTHKCVLFTHKFVLIWGRLKTNFAWLRDRALRQVAEEWMAAGAGLIHKASWVVVVRETAARNAAAKTKYENQNQIHSVNFLSAVTVGQGILFQFCVFLQIMPQFLDLFLINGSHLFLARSTGKEFALKIIDKAKCCGKVVYNNVRV